MKNFLKLNSRDKKNNFYRNSLKNNLKMKKNQQKKKRSFNSNLQKSKRKKLNFLKICKNNKDRKNFKINKDKMNQNK